MVKSRPCSNGTLKLFCDHPARMHPLGSARFDCSASRHRGLCARGKIYSAADVPVRRVAIVFGAGLWRNGSPTPVLADRVTAAANLYFAGKVEKLLMSGDNRFVDYNEPEAMRKLALSLGVPDERHRPGLCRAAHVRYLLPGQSHFQGRSGHPGDAGFPHAARHLYSATISA